MIDYAVICTHPRYLCLNKPESQREARNLLNVLEIGCGKGGDWAKWSRNEFGTLVSLVGVDIAKVSLVDFIDRIKEEKRRNTRVKLVHANMSIHSLWNDVLPTLDSCFEAERFVGSEWKTSKPLEGNNLFNIVSCQFAMHYFFRNRSTALHFLSEVSKGLAPGGLFIGTTIDCRSIFELASYLRFSSSSRGPCKLIQQGEEKILQFSDRAGTSLLEVSFGNNHWDKLFPKCSAASDSLFGVEYFFRLKDNNDSAAVEAPEWIVPQGKELLDLLEEAGFQLIKIQNFHEFIKETLTNPLSRKKYNKCMNVNGTISDVEWSIAG